MYDLADSPDGIIIDITCAATDTPEKAIIPDIIGRADSPNFESSSYVPPVISKKE